MLGIPCDCDMLSSYPMNASLHSPIAPGKKIAACVCLLAVMLLWAPIWAAALQANGMACCTGTMCPLHGHSPKNHQPARNPSSPAEQPMHCDHSENNSTMNCDMSCCHDQGQTFVASIYFVLPALPAVMLPQQGLASAPAVEPNQILQLSDPLSPPPRNNSL